MKVKLILTLSVFYVLISASCSERKHDNSEKSLAEVSSVLVTQLADWNNGSIDGFMKGYWNSDSLRFITSSGVKKGWESVRSGYHKSFPNREKMGELTFEIEETEFITEEVINVIGQWKVAKKDTALSGQFSLIFQEIDGSWLIVRDHTW